MLRTNRKSGGGRDGCKTAILTAIQKQVVNLFSYFIEKEGGRA
jgi:hypothetical protein